MIFLLEIPCRPCSIFISFAFVFTVEGDETSSGKKDFIVCPFSSRLKIFTHTH